MYKKYIKRIIDFFVALVSLPFVLLVVTILAPAIYISDKGSVFYNAKRVGKDGQIFKMFKLRSMYTNAPDLRNSDGSTFNSEKDPRVTKIGRFMRKTSLDEIPQLLNVLKGDMSLVGPRPTVTDKDKIIVEDDVRARYSVKPGITGYAQAFYRNSITQNEKYKYDNYYAENISFLMDVKILLKTLSSVFMRANIYSDESIKRVDRETVGL